MGQCQPGCAPGGGFCPAGADGANGDDSSLRAYNALDRYSEKQIAEHYYPPTFPIHPEISTDMVQRCREAWHQVKTTKMTNHDNVSRLAFLYTNFYLQLYDRSQQFTEVFHGDLKKQGEVLVTVLEFVTHLDVSDPENAKKKLYYMGIVHRTKGGIRPWMYSVYCETLLNSLALALEEKSTISLMKAWCNVLGYVLRHMLGPAIIGNCYATECQITKIQTFVNTTDGSKAVDFKGRAQSKRNESKQFSEKMAQTRRAQSSNKTSVMETTDDEKQPGASAPTSPSAASPSSRATNSAGKT